jgi:flagellar FliL protein
MGSRSSICEALLMERDPGWRSTCNSLCTMSDEEIVGDRIPARTAVPVIPLVVAVVLAVLLATAGAGGVLFWAAKSGRLPVGNSQKVDEAVPAEPAQTKLVALDPLLVNLADPDGRSYLRVGLTLKIQVPHEVGAKGKEEKEEKGPPKNPFEAAERDAALSILGRETGSDLLAKDGKERLKLDLKSTLAERVPEIKVLDVLITEFLVQR